MKLGSKLLLAPLITAAVALGAGGLYVAIDWHQRDALHQASLADIDNLKTVGHATEQLSQVRADVFRTLALIASMSEDEVKAKRTELGQQVTGVQRVIEAMPANDGSDATLTESVKAAAPLLQQYLKQTDKAIDLSGVDPNIGIGAMRAAENTYAELGKVMQTLVARNETLQEARGEAARAANLRLTIGLGLLMLLATGGALFAAWKLQRRVVAELSGAVRLSESVAAGRLDTRMHSDAQDEIGDLVRSLGQMVDKLRGSLLTVRTATDHIGTAAREIASGNTDLSHRTEQAASRVQQSASSMEQLTGTVRQTADAARTANQLAGSASTVAQRGGEVVSQVVATMEDINASSRKISDIIGTIDGIAFQTNILALNAAVEAARAGEQGRGFAVVASEVRSLAQRSAEAAKEIKSLIGASVDKVESGTRLVADAGSTMTEIVASVQRVTDIIGEISAATNEQSGGLGQINGAVADLDRMTQQNAALVEESAAAAESLREQAQKLAAVVGGFALGNGSEPASAAPALAASAAPAAPAAPAVRSPAVQAAATAPAAAPAPAAPAALARAVVKQAQAKSAALQTAAPLAPAAVKAAPKAPAAAPAPAPASRADTAHDGDWETF
ncbi:methyl-accepting chemotaxis protein [Rubrivivax rivuli]|uniref:HAMP domain-containing protein n=1 Tax=Rubrivivax rivuli TaxID=1862385 RepID=A0A437RC65_9BURK|nr:methyl-accepting chemotaxis protein [Rubrivivax rivuli]RVU44386.1 HAMP domain-containing protein [Rubrivivax rivuli]